MDREEFTDCNSDLLSDYELKSVEIVEVYDDPIDLPLAAKMYPRSQS